MALWAALVLALMSVLDGCASAPDARIDQRYPPTTDELWAVASARQAWVEHGRELPLACDARIGVVRCDDWGCVAKYCPWTHHPGVAACIRDGSVLMVMTPESTPDHYPYFVMHEMMHRLLWCSSGDPDRTHSNPEIWWRFGPESVQARAVALYRGER